MEPVLALLGLVVSALLLLRMAIGPRRRQRIDAAALRAWRALRRGAHATWHWRDARRDAARAAEAAEQAIGRARRAEHLKVVPKPPRDTLH